MNMVVPFLTYRNIGNLGNGLHTFDAADGYLGDPESARDVSPLLPHLRALHRPALVRAEDALWPFGEGASAA